MYHSANGLEDQRKHLDADITKFTSILSSNETLGDTQRCTVGCLVYHSSFPRSSVSEPTSTSIELERRAFLSKLMGTSKKPCEDESVGLAKQVVGVSVPLQAINDV